MSGSAFDPARKSDPASGAYSAAKRSVFVVFSYGDPMPITSCETGELAERYADALGRLPKHHPLYTENACVDELPLLSELPHPLLDPENQEWDKNGEIDQATAEAALPSAGVPSATIADVLNVWMKLCPSCGHPDSWGHNCGGVRAGEGSRPSSPVAPDGPASSAAMRYRKKPVVIEAMRYPGLRELDDALRVIRWIESNGGETRQRGGLIIRTLEGEMRADPDDWIVRGVQGEFYPVKPAIFEETYEPAD